VTKKNIETGFIVLAILLALWGFAFWILSLESV
jgi:hypothetical protein